MATMSDLEAELRKCLPEFSDDKMEKLLEYLLDQGVNQLRDLEFLNEQDLLDSGILKKAHSGRLFRSRKETIDEEQERRERFKLEEKEAKERLIAEQKEEKERIAKAEMNRKQQEIRLVELRDRQADFCIKLHEKRKELFAESKNHHHNLKLKADKRVTNIDNKIIGGTTLTGVGVGASIGAIAGPPGMVVGGFFGGLIGAGNGLFYSAETREFRLQPLEKDARKQADCDEKKLLEDSGIKDLEKCLSNVEEEMLSIKEELKALTEK